MDKEIIYVGDPMCSWCWGFSPVLKQIQQDYSKDAPLRLIVGGLHAFDTDPMNDQYKATIKHHWEQVAEASGQPFNYAFFEREGFVLDTEPACRATVVVRNMNPDVLLPFYERIHRAITSRIPTRPSSRRSWITPKRKASTGQHLPRPLNLRLPSRKPWTISPGVRKPASRDFQLSSCAKTPPWRR